MERLPHPSKRVGPNHPMKFRKNQDDDVPKNNHENTETCMPGATERTENRDFMLKVNLSDLEPKI